MALNRKWMASPNYSSRGGSSVRLIVCHTAEGSTTIESLGGWFANPNNDVSSHTGADDKVNTVGEYVRRTDKAWTAANANPVATQIEACAFASWPTSVWDQHPNMLANIAAWIAEEAAAFGIPITRLTPAEAQGAGRGVCQHADLQGWGGNHWDCGGGFPMDRVLDMARGGAPGPGPSPPSPQPREDTVVVSEVVQHRGNQLSCAQASKGQLWHKYSADGGITWRSEPLIRPNGQPVKATVQDTVSISYMSGTLFITTEDEDNVAWCCRQTDDIRTGWDIRAMP